MRKIEKTIGKSKTLAKQGFLGSEEEKNQDKKNNICFLEKK
jgi:hypothetical protein